LITARQLATALSNVVGAKQEARYADLSADRVPPDERPAYYEFVRRHRPEALRGGDQRERLELWRQQRMTALYAVSTDPELRRELRGWLLARGANHGRRSRGKPTEGPAAAAADEGFAAWLVWVGSVLGELSDDERKQVAQVFFRRGGAAATWQQRLDVEAFAAPIVRAWVAEQKRERGDNERASVNALHELVVCPASRRPPAAALQATGYCTGTLYVALLMREGGSQQLKHLLAQHNFAPLTESAVFHALHSAGTSRALALVDALMTDEEAGDVALRALADARMNMHSRETADLSAVVGRIPQWWKLHPRRRGALLYVLAQGPTPCGRSSRLRAG
jgi:hypothetical protein